jgi:Carboxypeptidase regulatory-like domain
MRRHHHFTIGTLLASLLVSCSPAAISLPQPPPGAVGSELGAILGTAATYHGDPLMGAVIRLRVISIPDSAPPLRAVADPDGRFIIGRLSPGSYYVAIRLVCFEPQDTTVQVRPGQATTLRVTLKESRVKCIG